MATQSLYGPIITIDWSHRCKAILATVWAVMASSLAGFLSGAFMQHIGVSKPVAFLMAIPAGGVIGLLIALIPIAIILYKE